MVEIIVASIAAAGLVASTAITAKGKKETKDALAVSNGKAPGFMIEETYKKVIEMDVKLDAHLKDPNAHLEV